MALFARARIAARKRQGTLPRLRKHSILLLMALPALLYFFIFSYLPMAGIYFAFTRFNFRDGLWKSPFVGLTNFRYLYQSDILLTITKNTVLYNVGFIAFGTAASMAAAIFLSEMRGRRFKKSAQSIMFLPYFISYVLLNAFAYNFFNYEHGTFNAMLKSLGHQPVNVYEIPSAWIYILIAFYLWKNLGYNMIIYLAAILSVDSEIHEAAEIDGANIFQRIRHITFPHLAPTFIVLFMFNLGSIMKGQFDLFYQTVGSNGQLYNATDIIDTFVYRTLVNNFDMGMSSAAGLYQSLFGLLLVLTVNALLRRKKPEYALF